MLVTYPIPGHPGYIITRDGRVFKLGAAVHIANREIKSRYQGAGYCRVDLRSLEGRRYGVGLHHLLGLAFVHNPDPENKIMINHINGIRDDNRIENLEWITCQENLLHARAIGLVGKKIPCEMRNCDTGEITRFDSHRDMARATGFHRDTISFKLRRGETKVFEERRQYRYGHSDKEWYIPADVDFEIRHGGCAKVILLKSILTDEIIEFDSHSELCEHLGIGLSMLSLRLSNHEGILPEFHQAKHLLNTTEWLTDVEWLDRATKMDYSMVMVEDTVTGELELYDTAVKCSKANNVSTTNLNWWLKVPEKIQKDGKKYSYLDEQGLLRWKQRRDNSSN